MGDSNVIPSKSRQPPIFPFRAVCCRDASSLERDGHTYFACNRLDMADVAPWSSSVRRRHVAASRPDARPGGA